MYAYLVFLKNVRSILLYIVSVKGSIHVIEIFSVTSSLPSSNLSKVLLKTNWRNWCYIVKNNSYSLAQDWHL